MLNFFVKSKARRRLLQLLWDEHASGSVTEFSELAGVGFATAYRELHEMLRFGIVCSERVDGKEVFRANRDHPQADLLQRLVSEPPQSGPPQDENAQALRGQLRALGAPLTAEPVAVDGAVEEVLVRGAALARRDAVVARTLPLCLWHCRNRVNATQLVETAKRFGEKQALGFMLELTSAVSDDDRFKDWSEALRDRRVRSRQNFFLEPTSALRRQLAEQRSPRFAESWGFFLNMELESVRSLFDKFTAIDDR